MAEKNKDQEKTILLCKAKNNLEFDTIVDILENNEIPYSYDRKGMTIGPYFESNDEKTYIEIYVHQSNLKKANELIEPILDTFK